MRTAEYSVRRARLRYKTATYVTHSTLHFGINEQKCDKKTFRHNRNVWQGRHDSNMQPTVLETATLPLSYSPKFKNKMIILYKIHLVNCFRRLFYEKEV